MTLLAQVAPVSDDLLDVLLPNEHCLVAILRAFLDESERPVTGAPVEADVYCVAGYLFTKKAARRFKQEWTPVFAEYGGCHMKELVHRSGRFEGISGEKRDELVKTAVAIVKRHITAGVVASCWTQDITNYSPDFVRGFGSAYSVLCHLAMSAMGHWARNHDYQGAEIAYVFEHQEEHWPEADDLIKLAVPQDSPLRHAYAYRSHAAVPKGDAVQTEAADLFAWSWTKFFSESYATRKRRPRQDFVHLVGDQLDSYSGHHFSGEKFIKYLNQVRDIGLKAFAEQTAAAPEDAVKITDVKN